MNTFTIRRSRNLLLTGLVAGGLVTLLYYENVALKYVAFTSGWILLLSMLFLTLFNARKKLPFLPLARSAAWLQWHIYIGLLTIVLFVMHIGIRIPHGRLNVALAILFIIVAGSGVLGMWLSRTIPPRLSVRGEEILFDRIHGYRSQIASQARELALKSAAHAPTLSDYYTRRLATFFGGPRNFGFHLAQSSRPRHRMLAEIADLDRYLSAPEREISNQLTELVCKKDDLDYSYALQFTLKGWLFIHIGFTYSLLITAMVHATMVHAFHGGQV